jgi:CRISPR/Cas system CMR-associated protein Cmr1 (group 7 of RAMP superfamily)
MDYFEDPTVDIMKLATEQEKHLRELKEKRNQSKKRTKELLKQLKVCARYSCSSSSKLYSSMVYANARSPWQTEEDKINDWEKISDESDKVCS